LHGKVLGLLNKILPGNETAIVSKLCELNPKNEQELTAIADTMFQKAVRDPGYADVYSRAMVSMNEAYPSFHPAELAESAADGGIEAHKDETSFAAYMLQLCKAEFEWLRISTLWSCGAEAVSLAAARTSTRRT